MSLPNWLKMSNCGKGKNHCCWFRGIICPFLVPSNVEGFKWCCSLRRDLGSWQAVHTSEIYQRYVQPMFELIGHPDWKCGYYPPEGMKCNTCGNQYHGNSTESNSCITFR